MGNTTENSYEFRFAIIEFHSNAQKEDELLPIDLVPGSWIKKVKDSYYCKYPPKKDFEYVEKWTKEEKSSDKRWKSYPVTLIHSAADFAQGRRRLQRAFKTRDCASTDYESQKNFDIPDVMSNSCVRQLLNTKIPMNQSNDKQTCKDTELLSRKKSRPRRHNFEENTSANSQKKSAPPTISTSQLTNIDDRYCNESSDSDGSIYPGRSLTGNKNKRTAENQSRKNRQRYERSGYYEESSEGSSSEKIDAARKNPPENINAARKNTPENIDAAGKNTPENIDAARKHTPEKIDAAREDTREKIDAARKHTAENIDAAREDTPENMIPHGSNSNEPELDDALVRFLNGKFDDLEGFVRQRIRAAKESILYNVEHKMEELKLAIVASNIPRVPKGTVQELFAAVKTPLPITTLDAFTEFDNAVNGELEKKKCFDRSVPIPLFRISDSAEMHRQCAAENFHKVSARKIFRSRKKIQRSWQIKLQHHSDLRVFSAISAKFGQCDETKALKSKIGIWLTHFADREGGRKLRENDGD